MRELIDDIGRSRPAALVVLKTLAVLDAAGAHPELLRLATGLGTGVEAAVVDLATWGLATRSPSGLVIAHPASRELLDDGTGETLARVAAALAVPVTDREATPQAAALDLEIVRHLPTLVDALTATTPHSTAEAVAELADSCVELLLLAGLGRSHLSLVEHVTERCGRS